MTTTDALFGARATTSEKTLALTTGALGALGMTAFGIASGWAWWQVLLGAVLALDLVGGVVANATDSAKRDHHSGGRRITQRPILFAALHVQPILIGLLFPEGSVWWGFGWYLATLAAVVAVTQSPQRLKRPIALAACAVVALAAPLIPAPDGFAWVPIVLALKLPLAHAVPERTTP